MHLHRMQFAYDVLCRPRADSVTVRVVTNTADDSQPLCCIRNNFARSLTLFEVFTTRAWVAIILMFLSYAVVLWFVDHGGAPRPKVQAFAMRSNAHGSRRRVVL